MGRGLCWKVRRGMGFSRSHRGRLRRRPSRHIIETRIKFAGGDIYFPVTPVIGFVKQLTGITQCHCCVEGFIETRIVPTAVAISLVLIGLPPTTALVAIPNDDGSLLKFRHLA